MIPSNNHWPVRELLSLFILLLLFLTVATPAQAQRRNRRQPVVQSTARRSVDYSRFSHATNEHRKTCSTCHTIPTNQWQRTSSFPDITDYPDHEDCVSCHRRQFFRGAKPVICSVCHTQVSPRADARPEFRNPRIPLQFNIEFPHDRHQDVIAQILVRERKPQFISIAFRVQAKDEPDFNNCTLCHKPQTEMKTFGGNWPDGYVPDALTFKTEPTDHSACFACHWKAQPPVSNQCDGCHKLSAKEIEFQALPKRISLKFKHEGGGEKKNHVAECTTCHINITKSATLTGLKPDVPITACSECHNKEGSRQDISGELSRVIKDREFICTYCHTSDVGRRDPPASHFLISGREPKTRKQLE